MSKWMSFSKSKNQKSTKELYAEMQRLEKQEKDAQEKALLQQRVYELKHAKRTAFLNSFKGGLKRTASGVYSASRTAAQSKTAKKIYKKLEKA